MKAVVYDKGIKSGVLAVTEVEKPIALDNEVLVKIHAVSVNAADYRSMQLGIIPKHRIFGADIAGIIEAVGSNVHQLKVGDEVFGDIADSGFGGFAEYAAVRQDLIAKKPYSMTFEDAAAVPMAAVTALQGLRDKGKIRAGQNVLICGSGGGVGTYAVQLAKHFGAEVTAVCGPKNVELVRSLGADVIIDYSNEDFQYSKDRFDLILAVNGSYTLSAYRRLMKAGGIYVMVGGGFSQLFRSLLFGPVLSLGSRKFVSLAAKPSKKDLEFLINLVVDGKIRPVIDRVYPLDQVPEAMQYLRQGHTRGKVVIRVVDSQV